MQYLLIYNTMQLFKDQTKETSLVITKFMFFLERQKIMQHEQVGNKSLVSLFFDKYYLLFNKRKDINF